MTCNPRVECSFLSSGSNEQINVWLAETSVVLAEVIEQHPLEPFMDALYRAYHPYQYDYLPETVLATCAAIEDEFGRDTLGIYNKVVTLHLMSRVDEIVRPQRVPQEFRDALPGTLETTWDYLQKTPDTEYVFPGDFYIKDIRILTGRSLSCGSRVIDRNVYVQRTFYRGNGWMDNLRCLWFLATRIGGLGPFYRSHLDHRHMEHRTPEDTFRFRILTGALLELNPEVRGSIGSGWLTDPALAEVSPRYASRFEDNYPQYKFRRYDGISEETTRKALEKSKTRREAYERGDYQPVSYTVIRSRKGHLLRAEEQRRLRDA